MAANKQRARKMAPKKNQNEAYKNESVPLSISHKDHSHQGEARPLETSCKDGACYEFEVWLDGEFTGTIYKGQGGSWTLQGATEDELAKKIGEQIELWYNSF